jgi:hypothetical protein
MVTRVKAGDRMRKELEFRRAHVSMDACAYIAKQAGVSKATVNRAIIDLEISRDEWKRLATWLGVPV